MSGKGLSKEFLAERDFRIFKMRQAGVSPNEIGRRFNISTKAVTAAIHRQLEKLNREALMAYPEVLRMELERLDALQQAIWPQTQHRKEVLADGTEMTVEPDLKAVQQVLAIMDRRAKLLGMEQQNVNLTVETVDNAPRAVLAGASAEGPASLSAFSPETEARQLLELMGASGVLPPEMISNILGRTEQKALPSLAEIEEATADIDDEGGETVYG